MHIFFKMLNAQHLTYTYDIDIKYVLGDIGVIFNSRYLQTVGK